MPDVSAFSGYERLLSTSRERGGSQTTYIIGLELPTVDFGREREEPERTRAATVKVGDTSSQGRQYQRQQRQR